jgi:hypothetical protein
MKSAVRGRGEEGMRGEGVVWVLELGERGTSVYIALR